MIGAIIVSLIVLGFAVFAVQVCGMLHFITRALEAKNTRAKLRAWAAAFGVLYVAAMSFYGIALLIEYLV